MNFQLLILMTLSSLILSCASKPISTKDKLAFDHTFSVIEDEQDYFSMQDHGFTTAKKSVKHPGPVDCRFIGFLPKDYPHKQYLEWCYTPNFEEMNKRMMAKGESEHSRTGFGFKTEGDIQLVYKNIEPVFKSDGIYTLHKNFDWEENNTDRLLGWDYISFKGAPLKETSLFAVKYPNMDRKNSPWKPKHKNTVTKIIAAFVDFSPNEMTKFAQFGGDTVHKGVISNPHGFHIVHSSHLGDQLSWISQKELQYKAVVLRYEDKKKFLKYGKPDYQFQYYGQTFYGIRTKEQAWDILVTDSDHFVKEIKRGNSLTQWNEDR